MFKFRFLILLTILFILSFSSFAQDSENAVKQKQLGKLAEEILVDARNLKLPENRALVLAQVGSHLWETDRERAEKLFRESINELINAQNEAENEEDQDYTLQGLLYGQSPRVSILNLIAGRDAELALESQLKSRPANLVKMMTLASQGEKSSRKVVSNQHYAVQESNMENQFKIMAAEQNPDRAIELFRESLKSGVSYNSITFLKNLHKETPEAVNDLLEEVFEKLNSMNLKENDGGSDFYTMLNFLREFGNPKQTDEATLKISDSHLRSLADKVSNHWLSLKNTYYSDSSAFMIIGKYFPNRVEQIKKKQSSQNNYAEENERYNELVKNNPTAEELLREAENFTNYRSSIYSQAAQKLAQDGNVPEAVNILNENFSSQEAKMYVSNIYQNLVNQEISKGNFDAAENLINQIELKQNRINALISLSQSIYNKNPKENITQATAVLNKSDYLLENPPSTLNDISMKINIAAAYIQIEPETAFRMIEPLVPIFNEYSKAQAIVSKFRNDGGTRKGEYLIEQAHNAAGTYNLGNIIQQLQMQDFERTIQLINGFERFETRLALKLQLLGQFANLPMGTRFTNFHLSKRGG